VIRLDVKQGTEEWHQARLGIPTASQFHRIITPKGAPSSQAIGYVHELIAEKLLGRPVDIGATPAMERGTFLEPEAVAYYEMLAGVDTQPGGFCLSDDRRVGCSPDRLIGDDAGIEIKCPSPATHVGYLLGHEADKYRCQVQGCMFVTGRDRWIWLSYCPGLPPAIVEHRRDAAFHEQLAIQLSRFLHQLDECGSRLEIVNINNSEIRL
jgi:hypothetical protein